MIVGYYAGATAMLAHQQNMDIIANNIANVNTTAYKPQRISFSSLLYENMRAPVEQYPQENLKNGVGLKGMENALNLNMGTTQITENPLDLSIQGEGYFAIQGAAGERLYTRDGTFKLSEENGTQYLVNSSGQYLLDENDEPVFLNGDTVNPAIFNSFSTAEDVTKLAIYKFANPYALSLVGNNQYAANASTGEATLVDTQIRGGTIELSGVDLAKEMANTIRAQRAFQFSSRIVTTADEIENITNNLR